jgi:hypothetical protein
MRNQDRVFDRTTGVSVNLFVKLQGELDELGFFEWVGAAKPQTAASR